MSTDKSERSEDETQNIMFLVYEYARISDGFDAAEGNERFKQRRAMQDKAMEIRAALQPSQPATVVPVADERVDEITLAQRIDELSSLFRSLREAAEIIGVDVGYLSRLRSGEKTEPSEAVLKQLGLRRVVRYEITRRTYKASPLMPRTRSA